MDEFVMLKLSAEAMINFLEKNYAEHHLKRLAIGSLRTALTLTDALLLSGRTNYETDED